MNNSLKWLHHFELFLFKLFWLVFLWILLWQLMIFEYLFTRSFLYLQKSYQDSWGRKDSDTTERLNWTELIENKYFPGGSDNKESVCNAGDAGSIPGSGRSPGEANGNPLQYSRPENPRDRGAWWAKVHGVTESDMTEWLHFIIYI